MLDCSRYGYGDAIMAISWLQEKAVCIDPTSASHRPVQVDEDQAWWYEHDLITVTDAAKIVGLNRVSLWRYVKAGRLSARRVGVAHLLAQCEVAAFSNAPRSPGRPRIALVDSEETPRWSLRLRFRVLERDGFRCRYCGATAADERIEVDHVIPRALGGTDDIDNLVSACFPCNRGKAAHSLEAASA